MNKLGTTSYTTVDALGNGASATIGIAEGQQMMVAAMMRDMIYTDKILAFIREYTCNALDEHIKYSVEKPVEISISETEWKIRDFGRGLSSEGVMNIFGQLFASSKRECSSQTGMFGIGALSGHAYGPDFLVRSVFEGVSTVFQFFLEGSGIEAKGIAKVVYSEPTREESGIEVTIPLKSGDYCKVMEKTVKFVAQSGGLCSVNGNSADNSWKKIKEEEGFGLVSLAGVNGGIKCGWVVYPVPSSLLDKFKGHRNVSFEVPVGAIDITPSREAIQLTGKTSAAFDRLLALWDSYRDSEIKEWAAKISAAERVAHCFGGRHIDHPHISSNLFSSSLSPDELKFLQTIGTKNNSFFDYTTGKRITMRSWNTYNKDAFNDTDTVYILKRKNGGRLLKKFDNRRVVGIKTDDPAIVIPPSFSSCFFWLDELPKEVGPQKVRAPYSAPKVFRVKMADYGNEKTFTSEKELHEFVKGKIVHGGRYSRNDSLNLGCAVCLYSCNERTDNALKGAQFFSFEEYAEANREKIEKSLKGIAHRNAIKAFPSIVKNLLHKKDYKDVFSFDDARKLADALKMKEEPDVSFSVIKTWLDSDCFVAAMALAHDKLEHHYGINPLKRDSVTKTIERKVAALISA